MPKRRPVNRALRRNLLILCAVPLALGGLIAALALSTSEPPPALLGEEEYSRISADRLRPDNGAYALLEMGGALALLGEFPQCPAGDDKQVRVPPPFQGQAQTWEDRIRVAAYSGTASRCENSDPAVAAFLGSLEAVFPQLRGVLDSPVYLAPRSGGFREDNQDVIRAYHRVGSAVEMLILFHALQDEPPDRFLELARDHLALSRLQGASCWVFGTEPLYDISVAREQYSSLGTGRTVSLRALPLAARIRAGKPGELEQIQALLDGERSKSREDRLAVLRSYCMVVDDTLRYAAAENTPVDARFRRMFFDRQWRKESAFVRENMDALRRLMEGPFPPLAGFIRDKGPFGRSRGWPPLLSVLRSQVEGEAWTDAVWLAVAVERYRAEKGGLPARLEDLAPAYVPEIPRNPVDDAPWKYLAMPDGSYVIEPMDRYQFRATNPSRLVDMPGDPAEPPAEAPAH